MTLTEFLLARITEDEADARTIEAGAWEDACSISRRFDHVYRWSPARVLAECEAKRQIVERCQLAIQAFEDHVMWSNVNRRERSHARLTLHALSFAYAGHPDYRDDWRTPSRTTSSSSTS